MSWKKGLAAADLELLGKLSSVLPALERLTLHEPAAGPDGMRRLASGLGAGALPAMTFRRALATSTTSTASCASSLRSACQILAPGAALILT